MHWPAMLETLEMPEGHVPLGILMFGVPKYSYQRIPKRKTPDIQWRAVTFQFSEGYLQK